MKKKQCNVLKDSKKQQKKEKACCGKDEIEIVKKESEKKIEDLNNKLLRSLADLDNLRKRTERESEDTKKYAITKFARDVLVIADNLDRALDMEDVFINDKDLSEKFKNFIEGIKITVKELESIFEKYGIKKISPLNEKFDHSLHQAMYEVDDSDKPSGTVVKLLQCGYLIKDRLLRPALVGVSKNKEKKT